MDLYLLQMDEHTVIHMCSFMAGWTPSHHLLSLSLYLYLSVGNRLADARLHLLMCANFLLLNLLIGS